MFSVSEDTKVEFAPKNLAIEGSSSFDGQAALDSQDEEWRMLTAAEWMYLLKGRKASTVCGMKDARFLLCSVRGRKGMIIFPDDYVHPGVVQPIMKSCINNFTLKFSRYQLCYAEYKAMERAGCVFLPADGGLETFSYGDDFSFIRNAGCYWTATPDEDRENGQLALLFGEFEPCFNDGTQVLKLGKYRRERLNCSVRMVKSASGESGTSGSSGRCYVLSINYRNDAVYCIRDAERLMGDYGIGSLTAESLSAVLADDDAQGLGSEYSEDGRTPHVTSIEGIRLISCPNEKLWVEAANGWDMENEDGSPFVRAVEEFAEGEVQFAPDFYLPIEKGITIAGVMPECQNNFMLYLEEGEMFDPRLVSVGRMREGDDGAEMHVEYNGRALKFVGMGRGDEDRDYFLYSAVYLDGDVVK